ncbi:MAG: permease [Spirochaetales bacterium]|nr:permease [Spirochaetales bacterium]
MVKTAPKKQGWKLHLLIFCAFCVFAAVSFLAGYVPGMEMARNSTRFLVSMGALFPAAFIIIGLFEAWVDREVVEAHLGMNSHPCAYLWVFILASTIMAPLLVALPVASSLLKKGARLKLVLAFLGASTICRVPMTVFEAMYLGVPFSAVRLLVSIPLVILSSEILGRIFEPRGE